MLRCEDAVDKPAAVVEEALEFLNLPKEAALQSATTKLAAAGSPRLPSAAITPETAHEARQFYEEWASELVQLMDGDERFNW